MTSLPSHIDHRNQKMIKALNNQYGPTKSVQFKVNKKFLTHAYLSEKAIAFLTACVLKFSMFVVYRDESILTRGVIAFGSTIMFRDFELTHLRDLMIRFKYYRQVKLIYHLLIFGPPLIILLNILFTKSSNS